MNFFNEKQMKSTLANEDNQIETLEKSNNKV